MDSRYSKYQVFQGLYAQMEDFLYKRIEYHPMSSQNPSFVTKT